MAHALKVGAIILVIGVILFGTPFAEGAADIVSAAGSGLYVFFTELRTPSGSAVG